MQPALSGSEKGGWLFAAFVVLPILLPARVEAKSPIGRIEVAEGEARIVSIDGPTARAFTLWSGPGTGNEKPVKASLNDADDDFAQWSGGAVVPPVGLRTFDITFLCEACEPARKDLWRCYGVRYAMGSESQGGFIQIPGPDDENFPLNVRTLFRGVEGQWYRASPNWEKWVRPAILKARAVR